MTNTELRPYTFTVTHAYTRQLVDVVLCGFVDDDAAADYQTELHYNYNVDTIILRDQRA